MKIYTKSGDKGTTSLFSGKRVKKYNLSIQAYGTIDELNSWIGLLKDELNEVRNIDFNEIQEEIDTNPGDLNLLYELALSQIAHKDYGKSIENLLTIFKKDQNWEKGKAKEQLLQLFDTLGNENELTLKGRRKLSSMIFS